MALQREIEEKYTLCRIFFPPIERDTSSRGLCRDCIQREMWCIMGPYAGVDYNLTLCRLQSRLQKIYHMQPYSYARVDLKGTQD